MQNKYGFAQKYLLNKNFYKHYSFEKIKSEILIKDKWEKFAIRVLKRIGGLKSSQKMNAKLILIFSAKAKEFRHD